MVNDLLFLAECWRRAVRPALTMRTSVANVARSEDRNREGVVVGEFIVAVIANDGGRGVFVQRVVFATFDPGASCSSPRNGRLTRVEDAITRPLDVVKKFRANAALGFIPVGEVDRLGLVNADLLDRIPPLDIRR
jgi:hypothetical protein